MTARKFDVVVLGTGNAGQAAAGVARDAGRTVAIVDGREPGGTCALRGCVPKKVLVAAAEVVDTIRRAHLHGIEVGEAKLDWGALITREKALIASTPADLIASFRTRGIELVRGWARFVGPNAVQVDGVGLEADQIVVATGSVARDPGVPGSDACITSDDLLSNPVRPDSVVFVGSGVIAFEFAHVLVRAGSKVTVLGRRALGEFEPNAVDRLVRESRSRGIDVQLGVRVLAVEPVGAGFRVRYADGDGVERSVEASAVVNATGRVPDLDRLDLEAGGIETERGRPRVDPLFRSVSNPAVSFAGDALAGTPQLSPVASLEGGYVGARLAGGSPAPLDYNRVPRAVFSIPALAAVGPTEAQARAAGLEIEVRDTDLTSWRSSKTYAEEVAFARILFEQGSRRIVGATLLGHGAPEVIHTLAFAVANRWTGPELAKVTWAYPTFHADLKYLVT